MPTNFKEDIINEIENNVMYNVVYLGEISENMVDTHHMKNVLIKFTEEEIQFMLNLKNKIENGR